MSEDKHEPTHEDTINKSKLGNITDLQNYYDALNELEKQNSNLQTFDQNLVNFGNSIDRWPTLFEILNKKTQSPLDLWSFYVFMRDEENSIDYLDFWIDTVQHINLCKAYVKSLRDSLIYNSKFKQADQITEVLNKNANESKNEVNETKATILTNIDPPSFLMNDSNTSVRQSQNSSRNSKTSSTLLDLLMKNDLFEDQNTHRLSVFLRGESAVKSNDPLVNAKIDDLKRRSQSFLVNNYNSSNEEEEKELNQNNYRISKINPEMIETFIQHDFDEKHRSFDRSHTISRANLRNSTRNILSTYFSENSEKKIEIPIEIVNRIKYALENQGRDDPEVFDEAREYVFKAMEFNVYPNFLRTHALKNVTKKSAAIRLLFSMICAFAAFWAGYTLIFMDYQPKPTRAVVVIPFFMMSYLFFSAFYRIDPFLCFAGYSESMANPGGIIPIREKYVKKLLFKRSLFVLFLVCFTAAAFSIIFALVPGKRLLHTS
jgi:sarcosine oxidase delta subunit